MKLTRSEIEGGQRVLRSTGWLSQCEDPFREALLAESQWFRIEQGYPIARGGDVIGGMHGVAAGNVGLVPAIATPDAGLIHVDRAPFWFGLLSRHGAVGAVGPGGYCVLFVSARYIPPNMMRMASQ